LPPAIAASASGCIPARWWSVGDALVVIGASTATIEACGRELAIFNAEPLSFDDAWQERAADQTPDTM